MEITIKRVFFTLSISLLYCVIWEILEKIFYGEIQHRVVDDVIMLLFIPVIYVATEHFIK